MACNTVLKRHLSIGSASTKSRKAGSGTPLAGQHRHESGKELPKSAAQLFELASELFRTNSELLMRSQPRFRVNSELLKWISEVFKTALEGLKPALELSRPTLQLFGLARKSATWRNKVPRNHAVGIACSEYHETGAACAVEVSIENNRPLLQELERLRHIQRRPYDSQKPDTI